MIPMLLVVSFLIYLGLELTPGDAVSYMIPPDLGGQISPEQMEAIRESLGLNKSFIERYFIWLWGAVQGNFGYSLSGGVSISQIFLDRLPATLELVTLSLLVVRACRLTPVLSSITTSPPAPTMVPRATS